VSRRRVLAIGLAVLVGYVSLAAFSGRLSPLARGPLLDGLGPPQPYRWVSPPPDLTSTNQPPSSGVFQVPLDKNGSRPEVFVTSDNQVTIIVPASTFDLRPGQTKVSLSVDPIDPATLSPVGEQLTVFGNAYRIHAEYEPSGDTAPPATPLDVVLVYPVTPNLHASTHQLYVSTEGTAWQEQKGADSAAQQQAEGPMPELGYVVVAGKESPAPISPSPAGSSGTNTTSIVLIVVAVCVGLVGIGLLVRGRR
jgi:hypothetical protein